MTSFKAEYDAYCASFGVPDRIEAMFFDANAIPRGKWVPGKDVGKLIKGGLRIPEAAYAPNIFGEEVDATGLGSIKGDPDGHLVPVAGTLKPVPWLEGNVAQVLIEMTDAAGTTSVLSPRGILAKIVDHFAALGLRPVVATELEFYICRAREDSDEAPEPPVGLGRARNYEMGALVRQEEIMAEIISAAQTQGTPTHPLTAEYGPGQFEVNFNHTDDVLFAADTAVLFRKLVSGVVHQHDLEATFMAKPYADHPGNGMHVHVSLIDEAGENVLSADKGVSENLGHAVSGVLKTMRELHLVFAPHLNSFRRFQPASFAPTSPDWGIDHRGVAIRLPDTRGPAARLEHRISGADVNPYLVLAAILGGILHGLETKPDLQPALGPQDTSSKAKLTHDWIAAIEGFAASEVARDIFGPTFHHVFTEIKRDEAMTLTRIIPPSEYRAYLSRL